MLVKGDTPVCSGNTQTTTTDRITSTTICNAFSKATVLTTANADFPMVVECEEDSIVANACLLKINNGPILASKLILHTVSEELEVVR